MNALQSQALMRLNDSWGVASWAEEDGLVKVTCDDGDTIEIEEDGDASWTSGDAEGDSA